MAVDDTLMRDRLGRGHSSIRALLDAKSLEADVETEAEAALPPSDKLTPLPKPGDAYLAHPSPHGPKAVITLYFLRADSSIRGFPYLNLDSIDLLPDPKPGNGPVIVVRFAGITPTEVTISGRNLDRLFDYLGQHRMPWVRELQPKWDFREAGEPVITGIAIKPIED
jgi:hypothetical protein